MGVEESHRSQSVVQESPQWYQKDPTPQEDVHGGYELQICSEPSFRQARNEGYRRRKTGTVGKTERGAKENGSKVETGERRTFEGAASRQVVKPRIGCVAHPTTG